MTGQSVKIVQYPAVDYITPACFKTKVEVTKLQKPFNPKIVAELGEQLEKAAALLENLGVSDVIKEKIDALKDSVAEAKQAATKPEGSSAFQSKDTEERPTALYIWSFMKRFRHPLVRGRQIFAFTFWDVSELCDPEGRILCFFTEFPFQVAVPKSKEEWVNEKLAEEMKKGKTKIELIRYAKELEKNYKQYLDPRKWINIILIPTWSLDGALTIYNRVSSVHTEVALLARLRAQFHQVFSMFPVLLDIAESEKLIEKGFVDQLHEARDSIRTLTLDAQEAETREKMKKVPHVFSAGYSEHPRIPEMPSGEPAKTASQKLGVEGLTPLDIFNAVPIVFGLLMLSASLGNLPNMLGVAIFGSILFLAGFVIFVWRKRNEISLPIPEKVKEKASEAGEAVKEKVRGS